MSEIPSGRLAGPVRSPLAPLGLSGTSTRGLRQVGATLAEIGIQRQREENQLRRSTLYAEKTTELLTAIQALKREAEDSEDPEGLSESFASGAENAVKEIRASFDDEIVGSEFDAYAAKALAAGAYDVETISREKRLDRARAQLPEQISEIQKARAVAGTEIERRHLEQEGRTIIRMNPALSDVEQERTVAAFDRGNDLSDYQTLFDSDLRKVAGITADPKAFQQRFPHLSEEDRIILRDKARSEQERQRVEFGSKVLSDINVASSRAGSLHELQMLENDVESLFSRDYISGPQRTSAIDRINARIKALGNEANLLGTFELAMAGIPMNPGDRTAQDAIEAGFEKETAGLTDLSQVHAVEANIVDFTHIVPRQTVDRLSAVANSNDIPRIEAEAEHLFRIRQSAPQVIDQIDQNARILLENVSDARRQGASTQDVIEQTRKSLKMSAAERKGVERFYDASQLEQPDFVWLQDNAKKIPRRFLPDRDPEISIALAGPFGAAVKRHFMADPDSGIEKARERALADLSLVSGPTNVGRAHYMSYPPEMIYSEFGNRSDLIENQLADDVLSAIDDVPEDLRDLFDFHEIKMVLDRLQQPAVINIAEERRRMESEERARQRREILDHIFIQSDVQTAREFPPGYLVFFLSDEKDAPIPFVDENGYPHRFYPDLSITEEGKKILAMQEEATKKIVENRELNAKRAAMRGEEIAGYAP